MPSNEISLNIMCESTDKNGYKTWSVLKRSSSNMESVCRYAEIVDSQFLIRSYGLELSAHMLLII